MTKLFVGGLSYSINSQGLQTMFEAFGQVQSAQVVMDKYTNQSKGFGFVEMADDNEAQAAISALNETEVEGRKIGVSVARPREDRPSGGDFNRGGGGGGGFNRDRRPGGNGGGSRNRY
jgi:RNA recognition motif-containing protein